uniref:Uncharacterized protein n=1 Tax=Oryza meridionalis TaxID=40149 RepID=A0A0E0C327_9ORYZ
MPSASTWSPYIANNNLTGKIPSVVSMAFLFGRIARVMMFQSKVVQKKLESFHIEPFFFGVVSGLVVGFWLVFVTLLFKKSWRVAYFRLFDEMYDKAYVVVVVGWARLTKKTATI